MRLDKFLKMSGIIPRRTLAQEMCERGRVLLQGAPAKAAREVKVGDRLQVETGRRVLTFEVLALPTRPLSRSDRSQVVKLISESELGV